MVPYLNIVNASEARRYAYFTATNATVPSANPSHSTFYGPRTLVMLISTAVASAGRVLSLSPPSPRSSYRQTFIGPYIRCGDANATEIDYIDALQRNRNAALDKHQLQESLGYYAFTPSYDVNTQNNNTIYPDGRAFTALEQPRLQQVPRNAENEIWLKYYRYRTEASGAFAFASNGSKVPVASYSICRLWNTTYSINATFQNGVQTVHDTDLKHLHLVEYPDNDPSTPSPLEQQAYTAFMNAVSDQLVGSMALVMSTAANATTNSSYSSVDTSLSHTSLIGSNDLDYAFDLNQVARGVSWDDYTKPRNLSDQRLLNKALAQNQTMPFLIEQLSFNTTVSLMTAPLLAPSRLIDTIQTRRVNIHSYNARNLWLAYGLADFFVLLAILLGIYTIRENNAIHNLMISTILAFSRGPQLAALFPPCRYGKKPASQTMESQVRLRPMGNGGETIVSASDKEVTLLTTGAWPEQIHTIGSGNGACMRECGMPGETPMPVKSEPDAVKHEQDAPVIKSDAARIAELEAKLFEREAYLVYCDKHGVSHTHCVDVNKRCHERIAELEKSLADMVDDPCAQLRTTHSANMRLSGGQSWADETPVSPNRMIKTEPGTEAQLAVREPSEEGEVPDVPAPAEVARLVQGRKRKRKWDSYRPGDIDMYRPAEQIRSAGHPSGSAVYDQTSPRAAVDPTLEASRNSASDGLQHANEEEMPAPTRVRVSVDGFCVVGMPPLLEANDLRLAQSGKSQQNPEQAAASRCVAEHVVLVALGETTVTPHTHAPAGAGPSPTESDDADITAGALQVDPRDSTLRIGKRQHPPPRAPGPKAAKRRVGPLPRPPPISE
ncbi:hypothetical protein LTR95_007767 [Oleoguttula sp. CCFEE 5521]